MRRHRVGVVTPYWGFWEDSVGGDLRADRHDLTEAVSALLPDVEIVANAMVDDVAGGEAFGRMLAEQAVDAVLVVQSMAVPPSYVSRLVECIPGVPLVVLAAHRTGVLDDTFGHSDITRQGATVGVPQLTNVLHRQGRPHVVVTGRVSDPQLAQRLREAVSRAAVAGRLRRARIGRVGLPIPGYDCVDVDDEALARATGIRLVPIDPITVAERYRVVDVDSATQVERELSATSERSDTLTAEGLGRSVRLAVALERLGTELELDGGAMNCHVPEIRFADDPGVTPCLGLSRETARGRPWSCTGDVVTAVAMLTTKLIAGVAFYHEIECLDYASGEAVLASSGECDSGWADPQDSVALTQNVWFTGDQVCGACLSFSLAPGPASLVGFVPHADEASGFRFVVAEGEITGRRFPRTGTAHGAFRFAGDVAVDLAWTRWADAGVNHHASAAPGHLAEAIGEIARHLGVGCVAIV